MFKPHYGFCKFCEKDGQLIAVRSGHCQQCNYNLKQSKKKAAGKKTGKYNYVRQATGEGSMFAEMALNTIGDEPTKCAVCGTILAVLTHNNYAHILPKGKFPKMRLEPRNIAILCHRTIADADGNQGCHFMWDMQPRSKILNDPKWQKMLEREEQLKEEYKQLED